MTEAEHQERLRVIEAETGAIKAETEKIRQQIMQLEFQHKKDSVETDKQFKEWHERSQKKIDHLIKLVGLTYDELDEIDATFTETGVVLTRPRKRARIS